MWDGLGQRPSLRIALYVLGMLSLRSSPFLYIPRLKMTTDILELEDLSLKPIGEIFLIALGGFMTLNIEVPAEEDFAA